MSDDDPAHVWGHAIREWQEGRSDALCEAIDALGTIPDFAREFLADLARDNAWRPRGRPALRSALAEREIAEAVFAAGQTGLNHADAVALVAQQRGMREDSVRGVVEKLRGEGYTAELWDRWLLESARAEGRNRQNR